MSPEDRIRVMIVEDHFMVRVGLAAIVNSQPDMVTIAEAANGHEAIELFGSHHPDVTLMDLLIPGMDGVEVISEIMKRYPEARIIVVSAHGGDEDIFRAMQAGARAYYLKPVEGQELVAGIRAVHAGECPLSPEVAARLVERMRRAQLSPRELEVFKLMAHGMSNLDIAAKLGISERTVRVHITHLLVKLGCNDKTQAVFEAFQRGILHVGDTPEKAGVTS
jgi:two-component system NarL family response regulator